MKRLFYREYNDSADSDSDEKDLLVMVAAFLELPIGSHLSSSLLAVLKPKNEKNLF